MGKLKEKFKGKNHHYWKGDSVGNAGLHAWVKKHLGKPLECWECGVKNKDVLYEWANISGEYKRSNGLSDWKRLCVKCHTKFDYNKFHRLEKNKTSKLKNKQVIEIINRYRNGNVYMKDLASEYGVSRHAISNIINRKTWKTINA